jgi:3-hydroxyisobutyrate dehydrogenase-like beta-hydroxyacid dehydrogenase
MAAGGVVPIHSTVHPSTCQQLQADFPHLKFLDAPVSGGGHKATAKELLVLVGGDHEALELCRPVLETFANPLVHLGPLGAGQYAKLLNNALFTAHLALASDTYSLAAAAGLDPGAMATALAAGSGRSYGAEVVANAGNSLQAFGQVAGGLLAKDVNILAELFQTETPPLIRTADHALRAMGYPRAGLESNP